MTIAGTLLIFLVALILLALGILNKKKNVIIFATIPFILIVIYGIIWFFYTS
ncbi:hypothetical protein [Kurthia sibirica]|uniref:hypothetical protein n=1 Tax=Kurthia sibirica TaxID=202750 RepID=UPI00116D8BC9|nr:hypothetical protein [Kurthia sibirica]GEK33515.1 hypothetical protein KSI01_10480 [Kurthia sibirica]